MISNNNQARFNDSGVVSYYSHYTELQPVEKYVFEKYIQTHAWVVDIGVGGGRTVPWISSHSSAYLGIDYAHAMVDACKLKFPSLKFEHGDACDLSQIQDATYDVAVFSFNGIDCIPTNDGRLKCLREMRRITRPGGVVIFSSHNAKLLAQFPDLSNADAFRKLWRIARAAIRTPQIFARAMSGTAFYRGSGYVADSVHGGLLLHVSTPESIARDCATVGLNLVETVSGYYPATTSKYLTNWYYYVCR